MYAPDAGLNTVGFALPSRIAAMPSPEPTGVPVTWMTRPSFVLACEASNAPICASSQLFFSLP